MEATEKGSEPEDIPSPRHPSMSTNVYPKTRPKREKSNEAGSGIKLRTSPRNKVLNGEESSNTKALGTIMDGEGSGSVTSADPPYVKQLSPKSSSPADSEIRVWQCHTCRGFNAVGRDKTHYWSENIPQPCQNKGCDTDRSEKSYDITGSGRAFQHSDGSVVSEQEMLFWRPGLFKEVLPIKAHSHDQVDEESNEEYLVMTAAL